MDFTVACAQSRLSADSVLEFPPSPPDRGGTRPPYPYYVYTLADLPGRLGYFQDSMAPARMQTQIIPTAPGVLSVSARKLCLLSEKNLSMSEMDKVGRCTNEKLTIAPPIAARSRIAIVPRYSGKSSGRSAEAGWNQTRGRQYRTSLTDFDELWRQN